VSATAGRPASKGSRIAAGEERLQESRISLPFVLWSSRSTPDALQRSLGAIRFRKARAAFGSSAMM